MKEHTRITVVQITEVAKDEQDVVEFAMSDEAKKVYAKSLARALKSMLKVDDVMVVSVQDFVADVEE